MAENSRLRVFHICSDYPNTRLYHLLMSHLESVADNTVYVPQTPVPVTNEYPVLFANKDFGIVDRLLYFGKQRFLIRDIKARKLAEGADIIHAHTLFSAGFAAYRLKVAYGIPYIVAVRNTDVNVFFHYMIHLRRLGVKVMEHASAVIFISPAYKYDVLHKYVPKRLRETIKEKSLVIPNGIDDFFLSNLPAQPKAIDHNELKLVYVGEISRNKNILTTLTACKILRKRGYNPTIKVVGKIANACLKRVVHNQFVDYHPHCGKEEVLDYYRQSDIFVMPSLKETFGLVYVEALSQGLPIIYSKGQGIDGYFPEGYVGYHVKSTSAEGIANSIELIYNDYDKLSARAIESSRHFSWARISGLYETLYKQIINKQ